MTPAQFRATIKQLGLSQAGAGRFLGVSDRTARRWASGEYPIPPHVINLLTLMVRLKLTPAAVDRIRSKPDPQAGPPDAS